MSTKWRTHLEKYFFLILSSGDHFVRVGVLFSQWWVYQIHLNVFYFFLSIILWEQVSCFSNDSYTIVSHFGTKLYELQTLRKLTFPIYDLYSVLLPAAILWPLMNRNVVFVIIMSFAWPLKSIAGPYIAAMDTTGQTKTAIRDTQRKREGCSEKKRAKLD